MNLTNPMKSPPKSKAASAQQAPDDGLRGQVFKITNECQPVFPCWLLRQGWASWMRQCVPFNYDRHWTHWHPDQPERPTVFPDTAQPAPVAVGGEGQPIDLPCQKCGNPMSDHSENAVWECASVVRSPQASA